mgnify:FL=1
MKTELWLSTKSASEALAVSIDTLKRRREICGGFLEIGKHYVPGPTLNSPITWCVEGCRQAFLERGIQACKARGQV